MGQRKDGGETLCCTGAVRKVLGLTLGGALRSFRPEEMAQWRKIYFNVRSKLRQMLIFAELVKLHYTEGIKKCLNVEF